MHPHHTLGSAIGGLPVEIWDYIIDLIAEDPSGWASGGYIPRCMLVCKTWVPRCRFHTSPFEDVTISSAKEMESYAVLLRTSPRRARSVHCLKIKPKDVTDCRWVTLVPVRLPRLRNLYVLTLSNIDFGQQDTRFSQFYSSFCCPNLRIDNVCGVQWPRLTVPNLASLKITTGLDCDNAWRASALAGHFKIRSHTISELEVEAAWSELASLSHRDIHASKLRKLNLSLVRSDLIFREDDGRLWTNVVGLFRKYCLRLPVPKGQLPRNHDGRGGGLRIRHQDASLSCFFASSRDHIISGLNPPVPHECGRPRPGRGYLPFQNPRRMRILGYFQPRFHAMHS
ncbi:hypothetical protein BXZ70DRAFT_486628 [Cristinia sonorae]|uniref:F-box domain-containing protein n=1 Tax=Cristinia sonorae TaxID=1940300 RepID=A0A8K0UJ74_9AGAR|nr:hypothetical protein BXZ70DRAFT_486628 [Cristinia sonorae]